MSAIYGFINLDNKPASKDTLTKMENEYKSFKIDKFESVINKNAAFGTGLQFITKYSKDETLPYFDEKNMILFTADCYLDNRDKLIPLLSDIGPSIGVSVDNNTPDGMLLYLSYLKWGDKMCDHLLGVFAIALYDFKENNFRLIIDHCGDRCVHYYIKDNTVYFSTIIRPIRNTCDNNIPVSDKYISACEATLSPDMVVFPGMTPYENIYQLLAGQMLIVNSDSGKTSFSVTRYYDPIKTVIPLKLANDEEYKKLFLKTYRECVTNALNVDGEVGCFLSSGLDSTSVASLASQYLKNQDRILHSYTSVPIKEFCEGNEYRLEDESVPVQKFCDHFGNITPTFVDCKGKSALTELKHFVWLFDSPIKYPVNAVWLEAIYKKAAEDGCKVILKGQHGNCSVSAGSLIMRLWSELTHLHLKTAYDQYKDFSNNMYMNKKGFVNAFISELFAVTFPKVSLDNALTKNELISKYQIKKEFLRREKEFGGEEIRSEIQRKKTVYMPSSFQQVSYANAHFELESGLIARDPTRDKRIIELCLAMPIRCFANGRYERRLITDFMKEIIPAHIINQMYHRGLQSADYKNRIENYTPDKSSLIKLFSSDELSSYLDKGILNSLAFDPDNSVDYLSSLLSLSLYYFLVDQK